MDVNGCYWATECECSWIPLNTTGMVSLYDVCYLCVMRCCWMLLGVIVMLVVVGCCWLQLEVVRCSLELLDVVACWMFLDAVGCPWELLDTVVGIVHMHGMLGWLCLE